LKFALHNFEVNFCKVSARHVGRKEDKWLRNKQEKEECSEEESEEESEKESEEEHSSVEEIVDFLLPQSGHFQNSTQLHRDSSNSTAPLVRLVLPYESEEEGKSQSSILSL
jgi:hypothetical protein